MHMEETGFFPDWQCAHRAEPREQGLFYTGFCEKDGGQKSASAKLKVCSRTASETAVMHEYKPPPSPEHYATKSSQCLEPRLYA